MCTCVQYCLSSLKVRNDIDYGEEASEITSLRRRRPSPHATENQRGIVVWTMSEQKTCMNKRRLLILRLVQVSLVIHGRDDDAEK